MKTMYTGKLYQNTLIVICCLIVTATIFLFNSYFQFKEEKRDIEFLKNQEVQVSFTEYVTNGFTLNQI